MTDDDIRNINFRHIINYNKYNKILEKNMYILAYKKSNNGSLSDDTSSFKIRDSYLGGMTITPVEDCIVDFGDGTTQTFTGNNRSTKVTHNYSESNTYTIKIIGNHSTFKAPYNAIEAIQLANSVTDCSYIFHDCSITEIPETLIIPNSVTNCSNMFASSWLTAIPSTLIIPDSVTNCSNMFCGCRSLTAIPSTLTIPNSVTDCSSMFDNCTKITAIPETLKIPNSVTNCSYMFDYCICLTTIPSTFTIPNSVTNCNSMFSSCESLKSDISNIWPSTWDYTGTIYVRGMFSNCPKVVGTVPADKLWNSGKTFNSTQCFFGCTSLDNYDKIPADWK